MVTSEQPWEPWDSIVSLLYWLYHHEILEAHRWTQWGFHLSVGCKLISHRDITKTFGTEWESTGSHGFRCTLTKPTSAWDHGRPQAWARGGEGRALAPGNVVQCFCTLVVNSKRLGRRIIYVLCSQPVIGFWELGPRSHRAPSLDPTGGLSSPDPLFAHPWKKILQAPCIGYHEYTTETQ